MLLGEEGVDAQDQPIAVDRPEKIPRIRRIVFTAEKDVGGIDAIPFTGGADAFVEILDARAVVMDGEWFEELFAQAVADEGHVDVAGKVEGDHHDSIKGSSLGEELFELRALIFIDGFSVHRR